MPTAPMSNPALDMTLALDMDAAPMQERTRFRAVIAAPPPKATPALPRAGSVDDIALYRADELAAARRLVEEAEGERDRVVSLARAQEQSKVTVLRDAAVALSQEIDADRNRLRWNSPAYDYEFARAVLGDAAIPPKSPVPPPTDPFAVLAGEDK